MNKHGLKSMPHPILGSFEPIEDLLYHDCPYVFTFRDAEEGLAIAYLSAMDKHSSHYLAVRIDEKELKELKEGSLPLRRVFRGWAWDITVDENADIVSVRQKRVQDLGADDLPPTDLHL